MEGEEEVVTTRVLTIPNVVSTVRLALIPIFFWLFVTRRGDIASFLLLFVIGSTDWVDGFLARRLGQVSRLGKLLDPVADRIAVVAIVVALLFRGTIGIAVSAVILLRDLIVSIVFPLLEARGYPRIPVNVVGKAATASIYSGVGLSVLSLIMDPSFLIASVGAGFLWVGAALYWIAGVLYVRELIAISKARRGSP